jgi:cytochrome c-type biogenesis protein
MLMGASKDTLLFASRSRKLAVFLAVLLALGLVLGYTANYVTSMHETAAEEVTPNQFSLIVGGSSHVAVFFSTQGCPNCDLMRPIWQDLSARYGNSIRFVEVSYSLASSPIFEKYGVYNTPVFIVFVNGDNISRHDGTFSSSVTMSGFLQNYWSSGASPSSSSSSSFLISQSNALLVESPSLLVSFILGLSIFASPCVLPLLPGYLGFLMGRSKLAERGRKSTGIGIGTVSSFLAGAVGILAVGAAFVVFGDLLWNVVLSSKLIISFVLLALGVAALFNIGTISSVPRVLTMTASTRNFVRDVSTYSLLYSLLSLGCSLPLVVGGMLNILGGVDVYSMVLRLLALAIGFALPLSIVTYACAKGVSFSGSGIGKGGSILRSLGAVAMIVASLLLVLTL